MVLLGQMSELLQTLLFLWDITHITFTENPVELEELDLKDNRLLRLDFTPPDTLQILNLKRNPYLELSEELADFMNTHEYCKM